MHTAQVRLEESLKFSPYLCIKHPSLLPKIWAKSLKAALTILVNVTDSEVVKAGMPLTVIILLLKV